MYGDQHAAYIGISGFSSKSTCVKSGNNYALKVDDLQGRIYINDGVDHYGGNNSSASQNLKRILNALVQHEHLPGQSAPKNLGQRIINSRPLTGYRNVFEALRILQTEFGGRYEI